MLDEFLALSSEEQDAVLASLTDEEATTLFAELDAWQLANESILDFMQRVKPHFARADHFRIYTEKLQLGVGGNIRLVFAAPPQHGKAVANETPMLTARGWIPAGEVVVGDRLVGADGEWTCVRAVWPQGVKALNRVHFADGAQLDVCNEHLWSVRQRYGHPAVLRTTEQLRNDLREDLGRSMQRASGSGWRCKWRVPVVAPLTCLDPSKLPVDPYLFGVWIGDGHTANGYVTTMDPEICAAFEAQGYALRKLAGNGTGKASTYAVQGLTKQLRELGVIGRKFVPDAYLLSSQADRLALLQGMCDTDGTVAKNGGQQSYCSTDKALADAFKFLVCSLGGTWTEHQKACKTTRLHRATAYNIYFRLPEGMSGFRLARKASLLNPYNPRQQVRRLIHSIERIDPGEAVCFTVDAPDHLFCAGRDLVVTHNSECTLHGLVWAARRFPGKRHAYVTYNQDRAREVSKMVRLLLDDAGVEYTGTIDRVRLPNGGKILFTSIDGGITGEPVDGLCIIDDPIKNRTEADSQQRRKVVEFSYREAIATRCHPGASVFVLATRWHPQDLSGLLIAGGWEYINLPAIAEGFDDPNGRAPGEPLFPAVRPLEFLEQQKRELLDFSFAALYQGRPRPKGGKIFHEPTFYRELPTKRFRGAFGVDLAYTAKTSADYSICLELLREERDNAKPLFYVIKVDRAQTEAPIFTSTLKERHDEKRNHPMLWRASGTEKGAADFIRAQGVPLDVQQPPGDKLVSATDVASAWNDGRVLVPDVEVYPEAARWLHAFLDIVANFTGGGKETDDDVDALGNAYELLKGDDAGAATFFA